MIRYDLEQIWKYDYKKYVYDKRKPIQRGITLLIYPKLTVILFSPSALDFFFL